MREEHTCYEFMSTRTHPMTHTFLNDSINYHMNIDSNEYGNYYERYVKLSNNVPLIDQLRSNAGEMSALIKGLTEEDALYRYQKEKWTLKDVFGHITDTELIFTYRALVVARGEPRALPGFDQEIYMQNARFSEMNLDQLLQYYEHTRETTISLFSNFNDDELKRRGTISGSEFTVRACGYVIAGHELHHLNIINEKYMPGITG